MNDNLKYLQLVVYNLKAEIFCANKKRFLYNFLRVSMINPTLDLSKNWTLLQNQYTVIQFMTKQAASLFVFISWCPRFLSACHSAQGPEERYNSLMKTFVFNDHFRYFSL